MFVLLATVLSACAPPWRETYLKEATKRGTRDEITKRLGAPHFTRTLDSEGSVWVYQYRGTRSIFTGLRGRGHGGGSYCLEYILTFDREKILREWRQQDCN